MQFQYVAYTLQKGVVKGRVEARSEAEARADLTYHGLKPLSVSRAMQLPSIEKLFPSLYQIKVGELITFARQTATMLASGATLLRALEMLQAEVSSKPMRNIMADIHSRVSEGEEFTSALRKHPEVFDEVFTSLVEVGEYTGRLGSALQQLADIMERAHEAKKRAVKQMAMPMFLIGTSFAMLGFISLMALPPLIDTFKGMGIPTPTMTAIMIGSVTWLKVNIIQVLVGGVTAFVLYKVLRRFATTRYWVDLVKLRLPLMGSLILASEVGRFSRVLSTLLGSGVDLPAALRLGLGTSKNEVIRRAWADADESLMIGQRMAEALSRHPMVPRMFVELLAIGEETNSLPRTTGELADAYEQKFEDGIGAILAVAEPASTFAVGGAVLFMALSVMKPVLSAANNIGQLSD